MRYQLHPFAWGPHGVVVQVYPRYNCHGLCRVLSPEGHPQKMPYILSEPSATTCFISQLNVEWGLSDDITADGLPMKISTSNLHLHGCLSNIFP